MVAVGEGSCVRPDHVAVARPAERQAARMAGKHLRTHWGWPMMATDFTQIIGPLAQSFFGEPNRAMSSEFELRYGARGSLSVDLKKGTWFDHEADEGGGVLDLVTRETK